MVLPVCVVLSVGRWSQCQPIITAWQHSSTINATRTKKIAQQQSKHSEQSPWWSGLAAWNRQSQQQPKHNHSRHKDITNADKLKKMKWIWRHAVKLSHATEHLLSTFPLDYKAGLKHSWTEKFLFFSVVRQSKNISIIAKAPYPHTHIAVDWLCVLPTAVCGILQRRASPSLERNEKNCYDQKAVPSQCTGA